MKINFIGLLFLSFVFVGCGNPYGDSQSVIDDGHSPGNGSSGGVVDTSLSSIYLGNAQDLGNLTTYNFTSLTFGTAATTRDILVGVTGRAAGNRTVTNVDIGGVTATLILQDVNGGNTTAFYVARVPTGLTGDIDVTFSGGMVRASVQWWSLANLQSTTAQDSVVVNSTAVNTTISALAEGAVFGVALTSANGVAPNTSWTGLNELNDYVVDDNFDILVSTASREFTVSDAAHAVTASLLGSSPSVLLISLR